MQGRSRGGRAGWRRRGLSPGNPPGPRVGCEAPPGRAGPGLWGRPVRGDCSNRSNCPPPHPCPPGSEVWPTGRRGCRRGVSPAVGAGAGAGGARTQAGTWHRGPGRWWQRRAQPSPASPERPRRAGLSAGSDSQLSGPLPAGGGGGSGPRRAPVASP